ncbi:hypothetical protein E4T47_09109 [Aureobasidium subglaciale]|nr:hypothetical protein E4T47_09109 [Aureobasidium subglaciale]
MAELTSLLRPETSSAPPPKDQVGHWYQAQLLHYGLPPSRDKNTAKVRLLQAINANTLTVPDNVAKLEKEMKKEFTASGRLLPHRQRARRGHMKIGGVTINVDQQTAASITSGALGAGPATKRSKTAKDDPPAAQSSEAKSNAPAAKAKKITDSAAAATKSKSSSSTAKSTITTGPSKLQGKAASAKSTTTSKTQ